MIRVLLVEDDPVIRDTTCYFLKSRQNLRSSVPRRAARR